MAKLPTHLLYQNLRRCNFSVYKHDKLIITFEYTNSSENNLMLRAIRKQMLHTETPVKFVLFSSSKNTCPISLSSYVKSSSRRPSVSFKTCTALSNVSAMAQVAS